MSYLCNMLYLKTKTNTLTIPHIRKLVGEVLQYCRDNLGVNRKSYKITYKVSDMDLFYGYYNYRDNHMVISRRECHDVKMIIKTVIHEYTHSLQNMRHYNNTLNKVGYKNHPLEIVANNMEQHYKDCFKQIKHKI